MRRAQRRRIFVYESLEDAVDVRADCFAISGAVVLNIKTVNGRAVNRRDWSEEHDAERKREKGRTENSQSHRRNLRIRLLSVLFKCSNKRCRTHTRLCRSTVR